MKNLSDTKGKFQKWMPCPIGVEVYFPGLAYLCELNELIVAEKCDPLHALIGKKDRSYTIFNNDGEKVFVAVQERRFNKFDVKIFNIYGNEVIHVKKPWTCFFHKASVWAPPTNYIGSIRKVGCLYLAQNKIGESVLKIKAQGGMHFIYDMMDYDNTVGMVRWQMAVFDDKNFGLTFPMDLDVTEKAILLGACFLIGFLKYKI